MNTENYPQTRTHSNRLKFNLLLALIACATLVNAQTIYGLSGSNLVSFNATAPSVILNTVSISGISAGQAIAGIDSRPVSGELYALGYNQVTGQAQVYVINPTSGMATPKNVTPVMLQSNMGKVSFDFNPTVDRIRVTGSNNANYRLNPITGAIAATDSNLNFAIGDVNAGMEPSVGTGAYTNSYIGATATTLYNYDDSLNILTTQNPPNNGTLNTIGASGITVNSADPTSDLDIYFNSSSGTNSAYFVANTGASFNDNLYTINLATGAATLVGAVGTGISIDDIAVMIDRTLMPITGQVIYALTSNNNLISFDSENAKDIRTLATPTGLTAGHVISGLDVRPATGELYGLGYNNTNNEAQLYTINTSTAVATPVGTPITLMLGNGTIGFDFNPTVDRIRVVSSATDANYRLNPITGAIASTDSALAYAVGDVNAGANPAIGSVAYTNSYKTSTATTLFGFDEMLNILVTQNPPNNGTLNTIGAAGITASIADPSVDMDIFFDFATGNNLAYFAANTGALAKDTLYMLNTTTGNLSTIEQIGYGIAVKDLAVSIDSFPTAISEMAANISFSSIYPNPANERANLLFTLTQNSNTYVQLCDMYGRLIDTYSLGNVSKDEPQNVAISTGSLTPGIYIVQIITDNKLAKAMPLSKHN
jgi:hypothetical protein